MNILLLTLTFSVSGHTSMYEDLLDVFVRNGHNVYVACSNDSRSSEPCGIQQWNNKTVLRINTGNITGNVNIIKKGLTTVLIDYYFKKALRKHFKNIHVDLILYPTPPITLANTIAWAKKHYKARTYLMLKDIFPQNAVDLGMMSKSGIKGLIYKVFRNKEKKLYRISDYIGCMSQANVDYVLKHNPEINPEKVEICPNSVEVVDMSVDEETRNKIRSKYDIPLDKKVFVYGGNLGKPQGIDFMIECLKSQEKNEEVYFLIVGDGTEYKKIEAYVENDKPSNVKLMKRLPKEDYDKLVAACDVGMIFLDHRFTIPNFPSRLLSYMQAKVPVLAVTDPNTDIGKVIVDGGFGWWCESNSVLSFESIILKIIKEDKVIGLEGYKYLCNHYSSQISFRNIMRHFYENSCK